MTNPTGGMTHEPPTPLLARTEICRPAPPPARTGARLHSQLHARLARVNPYPVLPSPVNCAEVAHEGEKQVSGTFPTSFLVRSPAIA